MQKFYTALPLAAALLAGNPSKAVEVPSDSDLRNASITFGSMISPNDLAASVEARLRSVDLSQSHNAAGIAAIANPKTGKEEVLLILQSFDDGYTAEEQLTGKDLSRVRKLDRIRLVDGVLTCARAIKADSPDSLKIIEQQMKRFPPAISGQIARISEIIAAGKLSETEFLVLGNPR